MAEKMPNRIDRPVDAREILQRAAALIEQVRQDEAYAAFARDQRTKPSATRSHDRRRLRSSARAAAAKQFAGIAPSSASTA